MEDDGFSNNDSDFASASAVVDPSTNPLLDAELGVGLLVEDSPLGADPVPDAGLGAELIGIL